MNSIKRAIRKLIKFIDLQLFKGKLRKIYETWKEVHKNKFFQGKKSVVVEIAVPDLIVMQYVQKEYKQYQFYDLGVRYLAIENYYAKNSDGFELYKKMHTLGGNYGQKNDTEKYYKKMKEKKKTAVYGVIPEEHSIEQFKKLIQSYEQTGYDPESAIMCDKYLLNMNGAHRLSLAVYRGQEFINVDIHNEEFKRRFSIDWFWQNGFSNREIARISSVTHRLIAEAYNCIGNFYCFLYPAACGYFDNITNDINLVDPNNIVVKDFYDYELYVNEFIGLVRCIYSFDSITDKNLNRKIEYILEASDIRDDKVQIRVVQISVKDPMYRVKPDNGKPESVATARMKEDIRLKYKLLDERLNIHKKDTYNHDVIIHSTDNYLSNKAVRIIQEINGDLSLLFNKIKNYKYVVLESGIDKVHPNFPKKFYLNEDIDFLVDSEDIESIVKITYDFCIEHFNKDWFKVEIIDSLYGKRVKVQLKSCLIIMFDYVLGMDALTHSFVQKCISERVWKDNYAHLSLENEICVRLVKYAENPQKLWHRNYIQEHKSKYDVFFDDNTFTKPNRMKALYEKL